MRKPEQRLLIIAAAALVFGMCLAGSLVTAFHQPTPHRLPVAVVAPAALVGRLATELEAQQPAGFQLDSYPKPDAARTAVVDRTDDGAFVVGPQGADLLVAGAAGSAPVQLLTQVFTKIAAANGQSLRVTDVAPLPVQNRQGLSAFFMALGVLFSSIAIGAGTSLAARDASVSAQAGVLAVFALLIGAGAAGIADGLLGALTGHYLAMAGILALLSLAISAPTAALARLAPRATALAGLLFIVLGIPATGGPAALTLFLPEFFRFLNPILPPGVAISTVTNTVYFDGYATSGKVLVLVAWAVIGLIALTLVGALRSRATAAAEDDELQRLADLQPIAVVTRS
jgi:hypothetical protein